MDSDSELEVLPPSPSTVYRHIAGAAPPSPIPIPPAKIAEFKKWHAKLVETLDTGRPDNGYRVQMQILLTDGAAPEKACLLRVLSTSAYDGVLQLLSHPVLGLGTWRSARPLKAPLFLPPELWRDPAMPKVNLLLSCIYAARDGHSYAPMWLADSTTDDFDAFVNTVIGMWDDLGLPAKQQSVSVVAVPARKDDLVLWKSYHASAPAVNSHAPHVSMFVDFTPRDTVSAADRARVHELWKTDPLQFGAGSQPTRNSHYNARYNRAKREGGDGGLATLGADAGVEAHYFLGDDSVPAPELPDVLAAVDLETLHRCGWLVVPGAQLAAVYPEWHRWCAAALRSLTDYLNWVVLDDNGLGEVGWRFDLARTDDRHNTALTGSRRDACAIFGDKWALYKADATGARTHTAQGGGVLITGTSGMGAATNLYDAPAQLQLEVAVAAVAQQVYGRRDLLMVPERMRVKTGNIKQNNELPMHTDALATVVLRADAGGKKRGQAAAGLPARPAKK